MPASAPANNYTFARFRFSSMGGLPYTGGALDGEVEDYMVLIEDKYVMKWIQHPDLSPEGIDVAACTSFAGDEYILEDWRKLTTSDHLYYMSTKYWADGDVHKYFSPYDSPYEAYINFMNVLDNLRTRAGEGLQA